MATRQVLKEEFLTCIICHEVFRDPVTLHCGHSLCSPCVTAYTRTQTQAVAQGCISCPHCEGMTKVPDPEKPVDEWTGQLKTSFFVNSLLEQFAKQGIGENSCSPCKDDGKVKPADGWCKQCDHALCTDCKKVHQRSLEGHKVSDITEEDDKATGMREKRVACDKHPDFFMDMLCQDCDIAVCQRCRSLLHMECTSVILLDLAMFKIDPILRDHKKLVAKELVEVQSDMSQYKDIEEDLHKTTKQVEAEVDAVTEKLMSDIRDKQRLLKEEVARTKVAALQSLRADVKSGQLRIKETMQRQCFLQYALESSDANTRFQAYKVLPRHPPPSDDRETLSTEYKFPIFIDKSDAVLDILDKENFGRIGNETKHTIKIPAADPEPPTQSAPSRIPPSMMIKLDTKSFQISGITVMYPHGIRTVVTSHVEPPCITSVALDGSVSQSSTLQLEDRPYCVTKLSDTKVASCFSFLKQIMYFNVEPELRLVNKVDTKRPYNCLARLTATTMAASDFQSGCIHIIDMSGVVLKSIEVHDSWCSFYLFGGENSCLFATIYNKLQALNSAGQVLYTHQDTQAAFAGVCQDSDGAVFVVDGIASRVVELTQDGKYCQDILTAKDGLSKLQEMYVDNDMLYVSVDGQYVNIYKYKS